MFKGYFERLCGRGHYSSQNFEETNIKSYCEVCGSPIFRVIRVETDEGLEAAQVMDLKQINKETPPRYELLGTKQYKLFQ